LYHARQGVHHGPKGLSELRSLDSRRQPGFGLRAARGDEAQSANFFNRVVPDRHLISDSMSFNPLRIPFKNIEKTRKMGFPSKC
jgi:hypothetical protein